MEGCPYVLNQKKKLRYSITHTHTGKSRFTVYSNTNNTRIHNNVRIRCVAHAHNCKPSFTNILKEVQK